MEDLINNVKHDTDKLKLSSDTVFKRVFDVEQDNQELFKKYDL